MITYRTIAVSPLVAKMVEDVQTEAAKLDREAQLEVLKEVQVDISNLMGYDVALVHEVIQKRIEGLEAALNVDNNAS